MPVYHSLPGGSNRRYLKFSPDSSRLAVVDEDGKIRAWDTDSAALLFESTQHPDFFTTMRYAPDSRQLVVAAQAQGLVLVLDAANGKLLGKPLALGNNANDVTFSPDGRLIATASHTDLRLWDAATHLPAGAPMRHRTFLNRVQFSGDGSRLVARERRAVRIWDTQAATAVTDALPGGGDAVIAAAFSPDGARVATATVDGVIRVWDASNGQLLLEPAKVDGPIKTDSLNFDPKGHFLTVLTTRYDFYAWPLPPSSFGRSTPAWLLQLATALAGGTVDERAQFHEQAADASTIDAIRSELAALPDDAPFAAWGRWFLADPATRPLAPGFTLTSAQAEKLNASLASPPAAAEPTTPAPVN
jgi:WD40 repeat protein